MMVFYPRGFLSNLEMSWLKWPEFFPNRDQALGKRDWICIGTKSRNLGDALVLTPLANALKMKHPHMRIYSFPRAFNPVVFYANPNIERICYFPDEVFGDDCNWDKGHLIRQKAEFFEVPLPEPVRPSLFLTSDEEAWAKSFVASRQLSEDKKPICVLHCSGATWKDLLPVSFWETIVKKWANRFTFLQVGMRGDATVQGASTLFLERNFWNARRLFAVMSRVSVFLGIDSGPMHIARGFSVPSLIFIKGADPSVIFERRARHPYFLAENWRYANLYQENSHFRVDGGPKSELFDRVDEFLQSMTKL